MNKKANNTESASAPTSIEHKRPLFPLGAVVATPGALDLLDRHGIDAAILLRRHTYGDFGAVCTEDQAANLAAIQYGSRILSAYKIGPQDSVDKIWVITEADRSATTLLLPEEY